jgi:GntR family transcriptional regulator
MAQKQTRYQQIADDLRRRIESREWAAGTPLPTEGNLQKEYKASRNTVRDAIKLLQQHHLLEPKVGQGTFITPEIVPFVTTLSADPKTGRGRGGEEGATYPAEVGEQGREAGAGAPQVQVIKCPPQIAARLKIEESKRVVSRYQERLIDGTIWSLQTSYYPLEWVQKGAEGLLDPEDILEGTVSYLAETIGLKQIGCRDLISARLPNDKEQELFGLTHNYTVIEIYRTSFADDEENTPIRVTVTVYPSDRNQVVYDIGTVPDTREEAVQL